tara:strand:+ start:47820 stop:49337 length:1518 start_codon:yes stop_codon:yes gene_type:complete
MKKINFFILIFFISNIQLANCQESIELPFIGKGEYNVGFKTFWSFDEHRKYILREDSLNKISCKSRPVLVNMWYPTKQRNNLSLTFGDYLKIESDSLCLNELSSRLIDYNKEVLSREFFDKALSKLKPFEHNLYNKLLESKTSILSNAKSANGKFPLIIYHSGAASSYTDNFLMLEYLASRGFIVLGSAFQKGDGSTLNIDSDTDSFKDIDFLIEYAIKTGLVDQNNITLLGHSAGAQAIMKYQATGSSKAKNLILLDTTQDNHSLGLNYLWPFTTNVLANISLFNTNILVFAEPTASFQLIEKLHQANRTYVTIPNLNHNEFISEGLIKRTLILSSDTSKEYENVKNKYQKVCEIILNYLKPEFSLNQKELNGYDILIEESGKNVIANLKDIDDFEKPPSPRVFVHFYKQYGMSKTTDLFNKFKNTHKEAPIYNSNFAFAWLYDNLTKEHIDIAKEIFFNYSEIGKSKSIIKAFENWCWIGKVSGKKEFETECNSRLKFLVEKL